MNVIDQIKIMRNMATYLIKYTSPKVSYEEEFQITPLKVSVMVIDGYDMAVNFSISDFDEYTTETIQIQSAYTNFLPFNIVVKTAQLFLGFEQLCYTDFWKNHKKVYCWTVRKKNGFPFSPTNALITKFEEFEYNLLNRSSVNLYES